MIDVFSKYVWAFPMSSTKSGVAWSKSGPIIGREHDIWKSIGSVGTFRIHTDNGSEFKKDFDEGLAKLGIPHVTGTPYHPWSQGIVERVGKTLKSMIAFHKIQSGSTNWKTILPNLVATYNDTVHSSTNLKPSYLSESTSSPWDNNIRQLVDKVKSRLGDRASSTHWEEKEIIGKPGDLARILLTDEDSTPSKDKGKTIKHHIANWSRSIYQIVSVGRNSITNGPL